MNLLKRHFSSTETISKEAELDDESILKIWKDYITTIPKKKEIIERLKLDFNLQNELKELKKLLSLELTDISDEEKTESELILDLEALEHSQKIKRVHRLEQCLGYIETKHEYVDKLLHHLHSILKSQMHIVNKLLDGSKHAERLISHLKSQFELELEIIKKIEQIKSFHDLFLAIIKGEHIINRMDATEKRMLKKMQNQISGIFSGEINEGMVYEWAIEVYNQVQDIVENHEVIMEKGYYPGANVDFEFVNRSEFVDIVKETIKNIRRKEVSDKMINAFVPLFREWYNHCRD